jgi:hypothetical protein
MKTAALSSLLSQEKVLGDFTLYTRTTIELKDTPPLVVEEQFTGNQNLLPVIFGAFAPLDILVQNRIEPITLENVSLEMTVKDSVQLAEIVGLQVRNNTVSPGEELEATIHLRPYGEEQFTVSETMTIPEDVPQGNLQLFVCDANVTSTLEMMRAQAKFQPQSLAQLAQILREKVSRNTIVMSLFQPKPGAVVQGQELPAPPVSMMSIMTAARRSTGKNSLTHGRIVARKHIPTHYSIVGCTVLEILIDGHIPDYDEYIDEHKPIKEGEVTP